MCIKERIILTSGSCSIGIIGIIVYSSSFIGNISMIYIIIGRRRREMIGNIVLIIIRFLFLYLINIIIVIIIPIFSAFFFINCCLSPSPTLFWARANGSRARRGSTVLYEANMP